jgi:hypothetical protein
LTIEKAPALPCTCISLGAVIKRARFLLNDNAEDKDTVRWPDANLIDFFNEALTHLQSLRPDLFTSSEVFEITGCSPHKIPPEFDSLLSVDAVVVKTLNGGFKEVNSVTEENMKLSRFMTPNPCKKGDGCSPTPESTIKGFSKNNINPTEFYVSPDLPYGKSAFVRATVVKKPPCYCPDDMNECLDVPAKLHAALLDWVMYRGYSVDIESEYALRQSVRYENSFYRFIANGYLQEARANSGYYMGADPAKGEGDPNVTQRSVGIR